MTMQHDPDEVRDISPSSDIATAGAFGAKVMKAATFAGLPPEVIGLLGQAANVGERHALGFMPVDRAVADLYVGLGAFVETQREAVRQQRQTAA